MAEPTDAERLADANDILIGAVENGPWALIPNPELREFVAGYVAENCHTVASAAGLDEAMERAHDVMPQRLGTSLPETRVASEAAPEQAALDAWSRVGADTTGMLYAVRHALAAERQATGSTATLAPVVDLDGDHLWLHPACGTTQWNRKRPDYCATCFLLTDRWQELHGTA